MRSTQLAEDGGQEYDRFDDDPTDPDGQGRGSRADSAPLRRLG